MYQPLSLPPLSSLSQHKCGKLGFQSPTLHSPLSPAEETDTLVVRNLLESVGFALGLSDSSALRPQGPRPVRPLWPAVSGSPRAFLLSLPSTSSVLPHHLPRQSLRRSSLAPGVCCLWPASPLSCLPVSTAISHYLALSHPGRAGQEAGLRLSSLCSPSSSFSRDKSKNSLLTDLPFPLAP